MGDKMINLDKFVKEELPKIKEYISKGDAWPVHQKWVVEAFEQCYKALNDERERCAKIVDYFVWPKVKDTHKLVISTVCRVIAEEIREGK